MNYLAGIPLSYAVREAEDPKAEADYGSFNKPGIMVYAYR